MLAGFTERFTLPGVLPPPLADSQVPVDATVYVRAPPLDPTEIVLPAGLAPPAVYEKAKEAGVAVRFAVVGGGAAATVSVTGTVSGLLAAPEELMLTLPL